MKTSGAHNAVGLNLDGDNWVVEHKDRCRYGDSNRSSDDASSHASEGSLTECMDLFLRTG